jgi:OmpA-OmpF porin, OOP family
VQALANLAEGEVAVADAQLALTGESLYRESAERVAASLPRALPAGWTARVSVQPRGAPPRRDAGSCRTGFDAAWTERLRFEPGSTALTAAMYPVLDAVAALAKACPDLRLAVSGHADPPGAKPLQDAKPAQDAKPQKPAEPAPEAKAAEAPRAKGAKEAKDAKGAAKGGAKPAPKPEPAPEPSGEDLARLRAQAVLEYLLQAGAGIDQVALTEGPAGERRSVALALAP